jgi:hypothetical protein
VPLLFAFGARSGNVLQGGMSQLLDVGKQLQSALWMCDQCQSWNRRHGMAKSIATWVIAVMRAMSL